MNDSLLSRGAPRRRTQGLTLIELMVVVAIMAIIAAIAYPAYTAQAQKSRRADAKVALENIALAQERFFTINGAYTNDLGLLQVSPAIQGGTSDKGYYAVAVEHPGGDAMTFIATATAQGAQADDATCTSFTINQLGVKGATGADSTKCW